MCFIRVNFFRSVFGAGTPVASFPVARREPAFRLLFNKPADRAYWLWMDGAPRGEREGEEEKRRKGGREDARTEAERKELCRGAGLTVEVQPCHLESGVVDNMTLIHL